MRSFLLIYRFNGHGRIAFKKTLKSLLFSTEELKHLKMRTENRLKQVDLKLRLPSTLTWIFPLFVFVLKTPSQDCGKLTCDTTASVLTAVYM